MGPLALHRRQDPRAAARNLGDAIDGFYAAGLPSWMWHEIVDRAMGAQVRGEEIFGHAINLAKTKVAELERTAYAEVAGGFGEGDWAERETSAVVTAAAHVWQSAWMQARGSDPDADLTAAFRSRARTTLSDEFSASDLMKAASAAGENDIEDLAEALEYAQSENEPDDEDDHDRDKFYKTWFEAWQAASPNGAEPPGYIADQFETHVAAACGAGYGGFAIDYAAYQAGTDCSSRLADYLANAHEVLRQRAESKAHWNSVVAEATRRWRFAFVSAAVGDESVEPDVEKFSACIRWMRSRPSGAHILQSAQQAGRDLSYEIDRYLPEVVPMEVPF